jgi:hypothetical protein
LVTIHKIAQYGKTSLYFRTNDNPFTPPPPPLNMKNKNLHTASAVFLCKNLLTFAEKFADQILAKKNHLRKEER